MPRVSEKARATAERIAREDAAAQNERKEDEQRRRRRVQALQSGGTSSSLNASASPALTNSHATTKTWRRGHYDTEGWRDDTIIDREAMGIGNDTAVAVAARELQGTYEAREAQFDMTAYKTELIEGTPKRMNPKSAMAKTSTLQGAVVDPSFTDGERGRWLQENPPRTDPHWNTNTRVDDSPSMSANGDGLDARATVLRSTDARMLWDADRKERERAAFTQTQTHRPQTAKRPKPGDKVQINHSSPALVADGTAPPVGAYGIVQGRKTWPDQQVSVMVANNRSGVAKVLAFVSGDLTVVESPARVWSAATVVAQPTAQNAKARAAESLRKRKEYGKSRKLVKQKCGAVIDS
jgi:hypothetical protein